ncbi:MAG TPA: TlpA disulfide reductase family protein [Flavipsychrobacter sp.]
MVRYMTVLVATLILTIGYTHAQEIPSYKAEQLMHRLGANEDTLYVVNFWATWCGPCIKELPEFDKLAEKYKGYPVKILLVNMDFKNDYPRRVQKFISKKNLVHEVLWLNESKPNEFIPKITNQWQGSIPATLVYYRKKDWKKFYEGMVKSEQMAVLIDKQLAARY